MAGEQQVSDDAIRYCEIASVEFRKDALCDVELFHWLGSPTEPARAPEVSINVRGHDGSYEQAMIGMTAAEARALADALRAAADKLDAGWA